MFDRMRLYLQPALIVGGGIALAIAFSLFAPEPEEVTPPKPVLLVDAIRARGGAATLEIKTQGVVSARTRTTLVSEVSGQITEVAPAFVVGGYFRKGEFLVRIDDRNYLAEVKRAEAALAAATTRLAKEKGLADHAAEDWKRLTGNGGELRPATSLALREPQLAEAEANLAFAEADLLKKKGDLDRTVILAPYDGIVEARSSDVGQFVGAGTPLAVTFAIDRVEIRLPIPHRDLTHLELPNALDSRAATAPEVTLRTVIGTDRHEWLGKITRTEERIDEKTRVLFAVAEVLRPYDTGENGWSEPLRVGTFVTAAIQGRRLDNVVSLPRAALQPGNTVWTIDGNRHLQIRAVEILRAEDAIVYFSSGIEAGTLVCLTAIDNPLPGTLVKYQLTDGDDG